ncbi:MAG TPA: 5'-nucleotidase C-terminal domain-containing protein [Atribacterota bacterium]|nr:5'-nucleotidase C-terminal domain-containing protein [Atribacterota bacterium]
MFRNKFSRGLIVSVIAFLIIISTTFFIYAAEKEIVVLSFNDFHGSLAPSGKNVGAAKFVDALKTERAKNPEGTVIVSAGDNYQGSAMSNLLYGEPISAMLKEIGVELSAVGNHEFDWGIERIVKWADDGNLTFVCANIFDKRTGEPVDWAKPYIILIRNGVKIGFIGLATPETAYKTLKENVENYEFRNPVESLAQWIPVVKEEGADLIIALTHLGSFQDKEGNITDEATGLCWVDGVDAVISAHTHAAVSGFVNEKPIVQANYNGRAIAKIMFTLDDDNQLISAEPSLDILYERADTLKDDPAMLAVYQKYETDLEPILGRVLGETTVELDHDRYAGPSLLGEWSCDVMREKTGAQIAMTNGGGLRTPIPAGKITAGKLYEVLPFDNTLYVLKITGADVKANIEHGIMNEDIGWIQISGVRVKYDKDAEPGKRIISMVLEDGTPVEMDKYYTVVTNDFMATGGDNYNFSNAIETNDTFLPVRDALMEAVEKAGVISPVRQNWLAEAEVSKVEVPETYVVVSGDSVWNIAKKFGTTMQKIIELNELVNPRLILPGQELLIPSE